MKYLVLCLIAILGTVPTVEADAFQETMKPAEVDFEQIDAFEAVALANQWKWSQKDVKSSVTAREVVFEFSDGTVKKIPLPEDRMLVAVAPFIRQTHR
jgi:hypothetical protein